MSLKTERLEIERKISTLRKEIITAEFDVEIAVQTIRQEASPALNSLEIDLERLKLSVEKLDGAIAKIRANETAINKLNRLL